MKLFDYTWVRVYNYYVDRNDGTALFSATISLSAAQLSNFLFVYIPLNYYFEKIFYLDKFIAITFACGIFILNFIRFSKKRVFHIIEKWPNEPINVKQRNGWLVVLYLSISVLAMFTIAAYFGGLRNRL